MNISDNLIRQRIGRFDQVRIITTKNVSYLSAPPGFDVSPKGIWSVTAIIGKNELLLARQSVLIRIPATDVLIIAGYSVADITKNLGRLSSGKSEKREKSNSPSEKPRGTDTTDRQGIRGGVDNEGPGEDS